MSYRVGKRLCCRRYGSYDPTGAKFRVARDSAPNERISLFMRPAVLRVGPLEDGNARIRILPQRKEIFVRGPCLALISREHISSGQLQMRQRANWIAKHERLAGRPLLSREHGRQISEFGLYLRGIGNSVCNFLTKEVAITLAKTVNRDFERSF